jgi:DNA-binding NarL/FixJ family response regulator
MGERPCSREHTRTRSARGCRRGAGRLYCPRRSSASAHKQSVTDELSEDEVAVVKRLADGQTNVEIAADLEISLPVVERHRTAAMKKLHVRSRSELARMAALRQW